jgi:hypothetical protein
MGDIPEVFHAFPFLPYIPLFGKKFNHKRFKKHTQEIE